MKNTINNIWLKYLHNKVEEVDVTDPSIIICENNIYKSFYNINDLNFDFLEKPLVTYIIMNPKDIFSNKE